MDIINLMLEFRNSGDMKLLVSSDFNIDKKNLNVIVIEILSWLKLERKRSLWRTEKGNVNLKPLQINMNYSWCRDLCILVEKEKLFRDYFTIENGKLNFSDLVSEADRENARMKAYNGYNPQMRK